MALSAKFWPFSALSSDKANSQKTQMNSSLFSADDEILEQLNTNDFELRLATLNRLRTLAVGHELWFKKFHKKLELFKSFSNVLSDTNWEVQHQCMKFLADTMRYYGADTEWCMAIVLPMLIPKLASSKITVRRITVQCLIAYVKQVDGVHAFQKAVIQYGLRLNEKSVTKEILKEIPNLFISQFRAYNWSLLTEGLAEYLCLCNNDREATDLTLATLERLISLVGHYQFNNYVQHLPANQKQRYEELLIQRGSLCYNPKNNATARLTTVNRYDTIATTNGMDDYEEITALGSGNGTAVKQFRYGIIPVSLVDQLNNETDWQTRFSGLETLKTLIENMNENDMRKLQPHLFSYINLLGNILDDLNIKNIVLTLDVLRASILKMRRYVEPHLQHIVAAMAKHLGNQKAVVKQLNLAIILELMRQLHPKPVFAVLCGYLQHRNSRVREEVLNIVTIALLTHTSSDFNLSAVAHIISPLLADAKRRVRLAAFECASVLANCIAKTELIMKHVREVEETRNAPGLVHAVQARLSRNQLPKIRYDGLLEYAALPISPSGEESRKSAETTAGNTNSADIEWIMSAGIGQGSAVSRSLSPIRYRSLTVTSYDKQNGLQHQTRPQSPAVRRVLSAGKNLRKLPWENSQEDSSLVQRQQSLQVERTINRSAPITSTMQYYQQNQNGRPSKLLDHLSNTDDTSKQNVPVLPKQTQQMTNGKLVLTPLDASISRVQGIGLDRNKSRLSSPLDQNELPSSPTGNVKRATKRQENKSDIVKTQSIGALVDVTANDYRNAWDETPIKPASKQQLDTYLKEGDAVVRGNNIPIHESPRKQSISLKVNGLVERRRSSESSDAQSPKINGGPSRKPVLIRRSTLKQTPNTAKSRSPLPARKMHSDSISGDTNSDLSRPYTNAQQALSNALKKLSSDEWTDKVDGINSIQRLAKYNTDTLANDIQPVIVALNNEAKNLRSSVSKQALECYAHLFQCLKRSMDHEVERICTVLMAKTGDTSNAFMRDGAAKALESMVDHVSPQKALFSIVATGANHKSATVRTACSQLILRLVENMGASKVLSSQQDFIEKIFMTASQFANDNQPQPRHHGKAILATLSKDPEFSKVASRCLTEPQKRTVFNLVDTVKLKGLGAVSSGTSSISSSSNASGSSNKNGPMTRSGSIRRKTKLPDEAADTFLAAEKELASNNWEDRLKGVNRVHQLSDTYAQTLGGDVKVLEMYMARLNDINGKVAAQALEHLPVVLENLAPHLIDTVRPVSTEMIKGLSAQLPSKNDDLRTMAQEGLDSAVRYLDNSALIQPLSIATKTGNVKQKPDLLKRLGKVSQNIFSTKPKLAQMHALPVLYDLIKTQQADQQLKQATIDFARILARLVGARTLIDSATSLSPDQKIELEDMLI